MLSFDEYNTSNENKNHKLDDADGHIRLKNIRNKEPGSKWKGICSRVILSENGGNGCFGWVVKTT